MIAGQTLPKNILPEFQGISLASLNQFKNDIRTAIFLSWSEKEDVQFIDCDLSGSNFSGANMKEAKFIDVSFHSVKLFVAYPSFNLL
ncbi:MAG: pentapeptide repeat-containing protein [Patescibacteria group bacterium]|nr:pentapeptide repeat-containing protein [Patescibacteria group bacterium]